MKKLLSLILVLALAAGLCASAAPAPVKADAADRRAAAVTLAVKAKLGLDTTEYDQFSSDYSENVITPTWRLNWSSDNGYMNISVTESGRVESYYRYSYNRSAVTPVVSRGRFNPAFPTLTRTQARETALAFLDKVLEDNESVELAPAGKSSLGATSYYFSGGILVNGLPSPFSFSIQVGADNTVTSFYRSGTSWARVMGDVPSETPAAAADEAGALLRDTFSFRLEYVLAEDGETAVLRYLPNAIDEFYVDAQTGKLVNLTQLYAAFRAGVPSNGLYMENDMKAEAAMGAAPDQGLTQAELDGVAKLEEVLSKEELDAALRARTALGLEPYTLSNVSSTVNTETEEVTARLQYARQTAEGTWRRYVTVDGKTGELFSVSSSTPWFKELPDDLLTAREARAKAEAFLAEQCGDQFAKSDLYNTASAMADSQTLTRSFNYCQKENGYFFTPNSISVSVDCSDGSISYYYNNFNHDVTFASPEGIVDLDAAKDAWLGSYDVTLQYQLIPVGLDLAAPEYKVLMEQGYTYLYSLVLAYRLERSGYAQGVDAHTGEALVSTPAAAKTVSYDDVAGHWVEDMALTLAEYDVGWLGGSMDPDRVLTQADLVALLVSTGGSPYDPDTGSVDYLYSRAYSLGILTAEERDDDAVVGRCQLVKLLLDGAGYGDVANIPGIFRCDFSDAAEIPAEYMGYVALAQGLKLVEGDAGAFAPNAPATRAQAATMLYRYLAR